MFILLVYSAYGFNFPGIQSKGYKDKEQIPIYINEMTSSQNQIPYDYYRLQTCQPYERLDKYENIGSLILGTKTEASLYYAFMNVNDTCQVLCQVNLSASDVENYKWFIDYGYRFNLEVDGLPVLEELIDEGEVVYETGIQIGYNLGQAYELTNHLQLTIELYQQNNLYYINKVTAKGLTKGKKNSHEPECISDETIQQLKPESVIFTYDVNYKLQNQTYSRWDVYKKLDKDELQWKSLSLNTIILLLLTILIAFLLRFFINRDILKFERLPNSKDDNFDEMGWKQVSRDVFRPPSQKLLLSVIIGTGIQIIILLLSVLFLSCIGFVYQAHTGNLATMVIVLYVFTGSLNGYYTSKFYKYFKGEYWLLCTLGSNIAFPLMAITIYLVQHIFMLFEESSSTLSPKAIITFLALQLGIQIPLNLIGTFIGYKIDSPKNPCKYYSIAQYVPPQPWYLDLFYCCFIGGLICFVSVGFELQFLMSLIWKHSYYEFYASIFQSIMLLFIISAEISIITVYLLLTKQNHRWWWKAFFVPFTTGIYLFIYSFQYEMATLQLTRLTALIYYFGTMFLVSLTLGMVCGTVGFLSSYIFVKHIYSLIKVD